MAEHMAMIVVTTPRDQADYVV